MRLQYELSTAECRKLRTQVEALLKQQHERASQPAPSQAGDSDRLTASAAQRSQFRFVFDRCVRISEVRT